MITIQENIPLKNYTTFRIGGPAKFFVEVKSEEELMEALKYAKGNDLEFFVLGGGSNLLVSDKGFDGIVIKIKDTRYKMQGMIIEVGAGVFLSKVVKDSAENNLTGMEWAAGIPGTIGGAVRGNAGAFGRETKDVIQSVRVLEINGDQYDFAEYKQEDCHFKYRESIFKKNKNLVILSVKIHLKEGNREESRKKIGEIIAKRSDKQPRGFSAGSFFINPVVNNPEIVQEFERENGITSKEGKVPAGWLIDRAGLGKKKIGGASVSPFHSNYIINIGNATAEDVIMLVSVIKQKVRTEFGVQLQEEVQYVGF